MTELYSSVHTCVCVYTSSLSIIFIHSPVYGHLGCFCILAIISNAAVNIGVPISFPIHVSDFFRIYTREWSCRVICQFCFQVSEKPPYRVLQWLPQFTLPAAVCSVSLFSIYSPFLFVFFSLNIYFYSGTSGKKKNPPASAADVRDKCSDSGLRRSPEVGNGNPVQ